MSSTSSSDNDCYSTFLYNSNFKGNDDAPFYPCVESRPLVYYAHIPQDRRTQRGGIGKKNNTNCFVKAFRWYTQELESPQGESPANFNIGGFAAWLDKKYEEFLHESEREQNFLQFRSKQHSLIERERVINKLGNKPKIFSRMKSPWKKRRQIVNDGGLCEVQSFKYLLRPQNLSLPTSECCQKTSSCNRSDATFVTSKIKYPVKIKIKSHSMICISKARDVFETQIDVITYDDDNDNVKQQTSREKAATAIEDTKVTHKNTTGAESTKLFLKNVSCECLEDESKMVDINDNLESKVPLPTSEDTHPLSTDRTELFFKTNFTKETKFTDANVLTDTVLTENHYKEATKQERQLTNVCCQCSLYNTETNIQCNDVKQQDLPKKVACIQEHCQTQDCQSRTPQQQLFQQEQLAYTPAGKLAAPNISNTTKKETPILTDVHSVQTSDHSIIFQQDDICGIPLFMKIVCANKLCEQQSKHFL